MNGHVGLEHDFDPASVAGASARILILRPTSGQRLRAVLPPTLVLLAAVAATAYQFRPRPVDPVPTAPVIAAVRQPAAKAPLIAAGEIHLAEPATPAPEPNSVAPVPVAEATDPPPEPSTIPDPATVPLSDPDLIAASAEVEPAPADRVVAEIVWDDIQTEADQARREREAAEAARGEAFAARQKEQIDRLDRARFNAVADRGTFHRDLRILIARHGRRSGSYIAELITVYGREVEPEIHEQATRLREQLARQNVPPAESVLAYRRIGLAEPSILDELAHRLVPTIGSRRGPRNGQEVLYFAARMLLGVPPQPWP